MTQETTQTTEVVVDPAPPPPASTTPYRSVPDAPPFAVSAVSRRVALWGPVLRVFGVVLWAFVVMGELVTSYSPGGHAMLLGEATGTLFVLGCGVSVWISALRRSVRDAPPLTPAGSLTRGVGIGLLALGAFFAAIFAAMIVNRAASDGVITVVLLAMAGGAVFYGRRLSVHGDEPPPTENARVFARVLWTCAAVLTFIALVALAAS
jgi:hypothetical protein